MSFDLYNHYQIADATNKCLVNIGFYEPEKNIIILQDIIIIINLIAPERVDYADNY